MAARILLVDDEEMVRETLMAFLEDEGLEVVAVDPGESAVQAVESGQVFDVCVMDVRLPGMDGNEAIRALARRAPRLRFLIHTGSMDYSLPADLRRMGLSEARIFNKPMLDLAEMARAVRALASGAA